MPTVKYPSGTVRINSDQAKLANTAGVEAVLTGVQPLTLKPCHDGNDVIALKEVAHVHELKVTLGDLGSAAYTIEWLENLPASPFIWPDSVDTVTETTTIRRIAPSDDGIVLSSYNRRQSVSFNAAKLTVAGQTLHVCAPNQRVLVLNSSQGASSMSEPPTTSPERKSVLRCLLRWVSISPNSATPFMTKVGTLSPPLRSARTI